MENQSLQICLGLWRTLWQRCSLWSLGQLSEDLDYLLFAIYNNETKYFYRCLPSKLRFPTNSLCTQEDYLCSWQFLELIIYLEKKVIKTENIQVFKLKYLGFFSNNSFQIKNLFNFKVDLISNMLITQPPHGFS